MVTYTRFIERFPKFVTLPEPLFDEFLIEARIEMGDSVARWLGLEMYDVAQAYFLAHLATVSTLQESSLDAAPMAPIRETDVDGVSVEYAFSKEGLKDTPDWINTTSYGQQYGRYRRMAFAGPRVA